MIRLARKPSAKRLERALRAVFGSAGKWTLRRTGNSTGAYGVHETYCHDGQPVLVINIHSGRCFPAEVFTTKEVAAHL